MSEARDPIGELIAVHQPLLAHKVPREGSPASDLTREALGRKLEALAQGPFPFFRGTSFLFARDVFAGRGLAKPLRGPEGLVVGDLHLENFGVFRGQSGALCFDVNDFDDVAVAPLDYDLLRLCTSALLLPGLAAGARRDAARAISAAWAEEVQKLGGRFPVPAWTEDKAEGPVRALLRAHKVRTREDLIAKLAPDKNHKKLAEADGRLARVGGPWPAAVRAAVGEYLASLKQLKAPDAPEGFEVLDLAYRFKGTGSLGRLRFTALLGAGQERRLLEIKETLASALDEARTRAGHLQERASFQSAALRRLQGDPWPRAAATRLGTVPALGRENEPEEKKLEADSFASGDAGHADLRSYADQCGRVTARLHCRANAPAMLASGWDPQEVGRAALDSAARFADQVAADHSAFVRARDRVAAALGLA